MPKINVTQPHALALAEAKSRMESVQADLTARYGLKFQWTSETEVKVSGKGVKGTLRVSGAEVVVQLDLSMLLSPMKGKIESKLKTKLAEQLQ